MDVLSDLLGRARAQGAVFARSHLRGDWGLALAEEEGISGLTVHIVMAGEAVLTLNGRGHTQLGAGDVVLVRPRVAHELRARPGVPAPPLVAMLEHRVLGTDEYDVPGDGPPTELLCGAYRLDTEICSTLLSHLPDVVHLRTSDGRATRELRSLIDLMSDEIRLDRRGRSSVLDRLLDIVLVVVLRSWFEQHGDAPEWYVAMADRDVGRALELLHADPARKWTIASLAREVGTSRSTLARRFGELVGSPPSTYLTDWRLRLAAQQLRDGEHSLRAIARSVGYESEFAFSAAFRRHHGVSPGRYRTAATTG